MADAERALGMLDSATATLPNPDLFVFVYIRKEAVLSSQIEGTQSSLADLLTAEAAISRPDNPDDVEEVSQYVRALKYGIEQLDSRNVTVSLFLELHSRLMPESRYGQLRSTQNWIGRSGTTIQNAVYVPPPPGLVPKLVEELDTFLNSHNETPRLLRIGLAHAQFESIHPFLDGNGRVGRLLISLLMKQYGLLHLPLLYLSSYFKLNRTEYYARLQSTRDSGDWESWLKFFLRGVGHVAQEASETSKRVLTLREDHRELLRREMGKGAGTALVLLDTLFYRPYVSVQSVSDIVGLTFAGANRLVGRFVELGVLKPTTVKSRNRSFRYDQFLVLFETD